MHQFIKLCPVLNNFLSTGDSGGPIIVEMHRLIQVRVKSLLFKFMFHLAYCLSVHMQMAHRMEWLDGWMGGWIEGWAPIGMKWMIEPSHNTTIYQLFQKHCERIFLTILMNHKQVGVISWGLIDVCPTGEDNNLEARDFHIDLFHPKIRDFLEQYLGNDEIDTPLHFI